LYLILQRAAEVARIVKNMLEIQTDYTSPDKPFIPYVSPDILELVDHQRQHPESGKEARESFTMVFRTQQPQLVEFCQQSLVETFLDTDEVNRNVDELAVMYAGLREALASPGFSVVTRTMPEVSEKTLAAYQQGSMREHFMMLQRGLPDEDNVFIRFAINQPVVTGHFEEFVEREYGNDLRYNGTAMLVPILAYDLLETQIQSDFFDR
jgi:hypothetical protein